MKKNNFLAVGGFCEEAVSGEDYIICQRIRDLGRKVLAVPSLSVIHYGYPRTLRSLFKREVWHGMGMVDLYRAKRITLPLIWSSLNLGMLGFFVFSIVLGFYSFSLTLVLMFVLFPFWAAIFCSYRNKRQDVVFELYAVFFVYGLARTFSLSKIVFSFLKGTVLGSKSR